MIRIYKDAWYNRQIRSDNMRLLFVTGGTGGHIYPALALADYIKEQEKDADILFVGNHDRMEATEIPKHGYRFIGLHARGLSGSFTGKVKAVILMLKAYRQALSIIDKQKPDVVIGFGGYVSAPVMYAAYKRKIPTMIHEQNSVAGVSNKMVAKYMDKIVICYQKCFEVFDKQKAVLLGNPRATMAVQSSFDEAYFRSLGLSLQKPLILIVMGSLGSSSINELMKDVLPTLKKDYQILYVTGKNNHEEMKHYIHEEHIKIVDYVNQLAIIKHVDLIICRAGATTLSEITALGKPSIIIPSPYVAHNHQFYNARVLVDQKAAFMIEEKDLDANNLKNRIEQIMSNDKLRKQMGEHAQSLGFPNACCDMYGLIKQMKKGEENEIVEKIECV